jgi:hypothetical protein
MMRSVADRYAERRIKFGLLSVPRINSPEGSEEELERLTEAFSDSKELEKAAKTFGVAYVESKLQPAFTVKKEISPSLNNHSDTTWSDHGVVMVAHQALNWIYRGTLPDWVGNYLPKPKVVVVVGAFNRAMDWVEMVEFFQDHPDFELHAGAWVRAAYLRDHPGYDGEGEIFFPDEKESLWADPFEKRGKPEENLHYPSLWHDNGKMGIGGFTWIKSKVSAGRRVVCIRRIHPIEK